ncbi:hypothetical protein BDB01DRAFT_786262 [Pilobolus umbonatus]|nr:hypothetical protein BDB01DRAFT_786262 [Pilobolus umbonatus]
MNNNTAIYTKHKVTTFSNGTTYVIHRKTLSSILLQEIYIVYALACHDANEHLIILCRDQNNNLHFIWASIQGDRLSRVKLGTSLSGEVIKAEITDTPFKMKSGRKSSHNGHVLAIGMRDGSVYIGTFGVTDTEVDITMKLEMVTDNDTLGVLSAVSIIPPNAGPRSNSPFVLLGYSLGGLYLYKVRATIYHPTAPRLAGRTDLSEQVNFLNNPISCCSGGRSDTTTDIFISFAQDMYTDRNNNYIKVCKVTEAKAIESVFYSEDMNVDCTLKCHPYGNTLSVLVYQPDRNGFRETHINMATTETMAEYFVSEKECLAAYNTSLTYLLSNAHLVEKMIQDRHRKMKRKAVRINPSLIIPVRKRRKYAKNSSASQKIDTNFDTKSIPVKRKGDNINPSLTIPAQKKRRHARYSSVDQKIDTIFNTKPVVVKKKAEDETHCSFSRLDPIHARKYPVFLDGVSQKDQTFGSCHNSSTNAINTEATRTLPEGEALTCISPDNDLNETGSILSENHFRSSSEHPIEENITTTVYDSTSSTLFSSNTSTSTPTSSVYNDNENIPVADNYSITHSTHSTIIEQNITYQNEAVEKDSHEYSKSTSIDSHTANHSEENNPKLDEEAYAEGANEIHKDDGEYTPLLNAGSNDNNLFVDYTGQTVAFSNVKEKPTDDNTQDVDDTALKDDAAVSSPLLQNEDILSSDSSSSIVNVLDNTQQLEIYAAHLQPIFDNDSTKSVDSEITIEPFNITASDSPIISIQKSENIIVADQLNNSSYDSQQIPDSYTRDGEDINTYNQVIEHQLDTSCFSSSLHDGRSRSSFDYFQERDSISVWSDNSVKSNKDSVLTDHSSNSSQDEEKNSIAGQLDSSYGHSQIDLAIDDSNISTHYNDTVSASDHSIHSSSRIRNESFADHLNRFSDNSLTEIIIAQSDLSSENDDGGSASSHSILSLQNNESSSVSSHSSQHNRDHFITGQPDMISESSHIENMNTLFHNSVASDDGDSASNRSSLFSEDSQNNFITGHTGRILDNISRELVSDQFDISPQNSEDNLTIIPPDCISQDSEEAIPEHHSNSSYNNSLGNIGVYIYNNDSHNSSLYPALHSSNSLSDCSIDTAGNILGSSPDNSQIPFSSALGNVSEGNPEGFSDDTLANPDDNTEMGADEVINQVTDITLDSSLSGSIEYLDEDSEEDPDNFAVSSYFPMSSSSHSEIEGIPDTSSTVYESFSENGSNPASTVYYDSQYESPSGRSSIASNTSSSNSAIDSMELLDYRNVLDTISSENEPPIADNPELHIESIEYRGVDHESNEEAYPCIHSASPEPIPIHEHSERPKLIIEQSSLVGSSESVLPCPSEELSEPSELPASDVSGLDRDGLSIIFTNTMEQRLTSAMNGMQNTVENMEYIMQRLFRLTNTIDAGIGRFVQFLNRHTLETEAHEEVQVDRKVVSEHSNLLIPSSHDTPTMNVHTPLNNDPSYTDSSFNGCITDMYSNNDVPDAHDMHNNDNELASENYNADNSDDGIDSNKGPSEQVDSNDNNRNESNTRQV